MISKLEDHHRQRPAYIYVRQSTLAQVRYHPQSTERQYALKDKALELGWTTDRIRVLDRDLGLSGAQLTDRQDFKALVADVSLGQVGAVLALEASRLARSCLDWHRLIEICALTRTLVIDEDGCYDPADFNDGLLLGLKGTIAQAELHFIRARLQGGKLNKAKKGELRFPLPVGLCYDEHGRIGLDPDAEVQGAVRLVFSLFRECGSAYGVVHRFAQQNLRFPKRAYGGVWDGKLLWGRLTDGRVRGVLKNPFYAGAYVFGRRRVTRHVAANGEIRSRTAPVPMDAWQVMIPNHHPGYIGWDEFLEHQQILERNRTNGEETLLMGPAREGLTLLQGLLVCGRCGRKVSVRYKGNGGVYPTYECNWLRRDGISTRACLAVRADLLDTAITTRALELLQPAELEIAVEALRELEQRDEAVLKQWRMRLERAEYEAQLAQRRYEEVDPSNRLVAATLERRWNDALVQVEALKKTFAEVQRKEARATTAEQKARVLALAEDFPRLWHAPTTQAKDRKRMLRLLIKDITIEKTSDRKHVLLHVRWQGGACEDLPVDLPLNMPDRVRYPAEVVQQVRELAQDRADEEIATVLHEEGRLSATGKPFTASIVKWIRYRHKIPAPELRRPQEVTVKQVAETFAVSPHVVYYWIERGVIQARRRNNGSPYWITLDPQKEDELRQWVRRSTKIQSIRKRPHPPHP